ncbi:ATP-binding protein [Wenzhouxiangella sp. XN24]|uniref:sensor histidine kinase n=1 Tax=Wenzhouxiangella sp. XN24 TaxID=2713569 RepID=UPI0013ED16B4|nr:ATP-binding protein [Wenzhouxiangella sp. XN24]NGX17651.1 HAMP domain-containing protein [Wenzhouxiangella sp. XN24]
MATRTLRRWTLATSALLGLSLLLVALLFLASTVENADRFGEIYNWIILLNVAGGSILLALIIANLVRLVREYRSQVPGSRLASRMVAIFVVLAVLPLGLVYYFSVQFISRGIDAWFDVNVEAGLGGALELSRATLESRMREHLDATREVADSLSGRVDRELATSLEVMRRGAGAVELTVVGASSRIIALSSGRSIADLPEPPTEEVMLQIRQGHPFVSLDPVNDGYVIRTAAEIPGGHPLDELRVLHALFPVPERVGRLANSVQEAYAQYRELSFLREPFTRSLTLTLTLVLLLSLLMAVWGAFFFARKLTAPIQTLVAGTRAVAKGDFDTRLPMPARDEMGFLVHSFNDMITRLAGARELAHQSQQAVESQRAYLAVILGRLSTGVVSLERDWRIKTANEAAGAILGVDLEAAIGRPLLEVAEDKHLLLQFIEVGRRHFEAGDYEWREQIVLRGETGRRVLMCACSALPGEDDTPDGFVVVFDDITALLQAQRDAAWGEVARRLAHEIKNPLTPIQLSAERIRRRFLGQMDDDDAQVLERATRTIVQQVEAMKEMVNAFSDYARAPDMDIGTIDLNRLVAEVTELYRVREIPVSIELSLDPAAAVVQADLGRLRQILHNLIRNAVEALEGQEDGVLRVTTRGTEEFDLHAVFIMVEDNGPGIPQDSVDRIFDPYVTSKPKGTGLGLAIVKKLVEEHAGWVEATNRAEGGVRITIALPADEDARSAMLRREVRANEFRRAHA